MKKILALLLAAALLLPASALGFSFSGTQAGGEEAEEAALTETEQTEEAEPAQAEETEPQASALSIQDVLPVFQTVAFAPEFGGGRDYLIRWESPIRIYASDKPTEEDLQTLDRIIAELNERVENFPGISRVSSKKEANIIIYFCGIRQMSTRIPSYRTGNVGFFRFTESKGVITSSVIGIVSDYTSQELRNHLIQEELIGCLGLANDHWADEASIVYQGQTQVQNLSELDWMMMNCLYCPAVKTGGKWPETEAALLAYFAE